MAVVKKTFKEFVIEWADTDPFVRKLVLKAIRWNSPGKFQKAHQLAKRLLKEAAKQ